MTIKFKDPRAPSILRGKSQINQDLFVLAMTEFATGGSFLEIGAGEPIYGNNTYILESQFGYRGTSVERVTPDYNDFFSEWYQEIKLENWPNSVENLDSTPDWVKLEIKKKYCLESMAQYHDQMAEQQRNDLLKKWKECRPFSNLITKSAFDLDYSQFPNFFTYLQIDIEPPLDNLKILKKICRHIRFAVITFEHDYYANTAESELVLKESREFLVRQGYHMVVDKVKNFEDWWVDPQHIRPDVYKIYEQVDDTIKHPGQVLFTIN